MLSIFAKGQHDASFFPAIDPRRINPDQKVQVLEAYKYKPRPKSLAEEVGLQRKQVTGILGRLKKLIQKNDDPFESFKANIKHLNSQDGMKVILPDGLSIFVILQPKVPQYS